MLLEKALCYIFAFSLSVAAGDENLLSNPGFEAPGTEPGKLAAGWMTQGECVALDSQVKHSGKFSARIAIKDFESAGKWQFWRSERIPKEASYYRLSGWLKAEDVENKDGVAWHRARVVLNFFNGKGERIDYSREVVAANGTFDWRKFEFDFSPPRGTAEFEILFIMQGSEGAVWLDDLSLVALPTAVEKTLELELQRLAIARLGYYAGIGQMPTYWSSQGDGAIWSDEVHHSGKRCLRISVAKYSASHRWQLWRSERIPLGSSKVQVNGWVMGKGIKPAVESGAAEVAILFFADEDSASLGSETVFSATGDFGWKQFSSAVTPPEGSRFFSIVVSLDRAEGDFFVDDLAVLTEDGRNILPNGGVEEKFVAKELVIQRIDLPESVEPVTGEFPESVRNLQIKDGIFYRGDRPVFLFGAVQAGQGYPWLCRLLGIDFVVLNDATGDPGSNGEIRRKGNKVVVSWKYYDFLETEIRELLRNGVMAYISMHEPSPHNNRFIVLMPELMAQGHYYSYCAENPLGRELRRGLRRNTIRVTRRYPIFCYELFNEVAYICQCKWNIENFRRRMAKKFGTIERANQCWGTKFKSFDDVMPPLMPKARLLRNWDDSWSVNLWADWLKFNEERFAQIALDDSKFVRELDPDAYITIQTNIVGDFSGHGVRPDLKVAAEDIYGHEEYLYLFQQEEGKESISEIKESLKFCLRADIVRNASPDKPIINEEAGVRPGYKSRAPAGKGEEQFWRIAPPQMRLYLWTSLIHGISGAVFFNLFVNEAYRSSDFNEQIISREAIKALPALRNEIESLGDIILPRKGRAAKVALLFSYETFRRRVPEDWSRATGAPLTRDLLNYYGGLFFAGIPVDVIITGDILKGELKRYRMLVIACARYVNPAALPKIREFVEQGGVVIVSPSSLSMNDETHQRLDSSSLTGVIMTGEMEKTKPLDLLPLGLNRTKTVGRESDGVSSVSVKVMDGEEIARFEDGSPALICKHLGSGKVYYLCAELDMLTMRRLLARLAGEAGVKPPLRIEPECPFIEARVFTRGDKAVWYAANWGGGRKKLRLIPNYPLRAERFVVRDVRNGKTLHEGVQLQRGIEVELDSLDPIVLLIEDESQEPLTLARIPGAKADYLREIWRKPAEKGIPVLIDSGKFENLTPARVPSAVQLLEASGFAVYTNLSAFSDRVRTNGGERKLSDFRVVAFLSPAKRHFSPREIEQILDFVRQGGGLVVCGNFYRAPHGWFTNAFMNRLLERMGVSIANDAICDGEHNVAGEERFVVFRRISNHPVTDGVKELQSSGMASIVMSEKPPVRFETIVSSYPNSYHIVSRWRRMNEGNLPVMAVGSYGKGRVVVIGDGSWMRPLQLARGDNARLLLNIFHYAVEGRSARFDEVAVGEILKRSLAAAMIKAN